MEKSGGYADVQVAGYRIEEPLGRGGMGEVYLATDDRLGRPVALKLLASRFAEDELLGERLLRESRLAASLDHPNVIPIYEAGEDEGRLFIAMRYVRGGDLRSLLRAEGSLEPARALPIFAQVAAALDAAHRNGLVHRDVKPSNVLLDHEEGREHCYLADFGLTESAATSGAADGGLLGTADYISPEQIRGDPLDGRADQYSLACMIFECLTGRLPFLHRTDVAALFAHLEEPVPEASKRGAGLPAGLDSVLQRGMAKEREERFETCTELVAAVAAALGLRTEAAPSPGRRRLLALAAIAAAAVVALLVVLQLGGGGGAEARTPTGSLVQIDPQTNEVSSRVGVNGYPGQLVVTPGGIWAADFHSGTLWRYRPGFAPERITSNGEPRDLTAVGRKVYVGADGRLFSGVVSEYDAVSGIRGDSVDLLACAMAAGEGVVWAAGCPYVQRLSTDDRPLRILAQTFLPFRTPPTVSNGRVQFRELAVGDGSVWVLGDALDRRLWRLDAHTGRVEATIPLDFPPVSVAVAGCCAWITDGLHDRLFPVAVNGNRVLSPLSVGAGASGVTAGEGSVWVANTIAGTVSRVDPQTRRVVATIRVGGLPRGLAAGAGSIWVSEYAG